MSNPQITGPTRPGPTEALRAVFSGIGRILMAADRSQDQAPAARRPPAPQPAGASRFRSLDQTGNVRLLTADDLDDDYDGGQPAAANGTAATGTAAAIGTAAATGTVLPLPSYDTLSVASIRARLRPLDVAQLRILASYEATHAERPEVLGMLERRIEKLETGG
jgi:hypothetical protein